MSETKQDIREQLKYMKDNKQAYIRNTGIQEYNNRINQLKKLLKERRYNYV